MGKHDFDDNEPSDYAEVLSLTEYTEQSQNTPSLIAEYNDIDFKVALVNASNLAKNYVNKVVKFIKDFKDIQLTQEQLNFIDDIGEFQAEQVSDLLYLKAINGQMIENIGNRINAGQGEDYAAIQSFVTLCNQQLKFNKEIDNVIKGLIGSIKKIRTEIVCNQELGERLSENEELPDGVDGANAEIMNETTFNGGKSLHQMLMAHKNKRNQEKTTE